MCCFKTTTNQTRTTKTTVLEPKHESNQKTQSIINKRNMKPFISIKINTNFISMARYITKQELMEYFF